MYKIIFVLIIFSFKLRDNVAEERSCIVQKWYTIKDNQKKLIKELFFRDLETSELIKSVTYYSDNTMSLIQITKYKDGLTTEYMATDNSPYMDSTVLNHDYFYYDKYDNLKKIVDSARSPVSTKKFDLHLDPKTKKVIRSEEQIEQRKVIRRYKYGKRHHIKETFFKDSLIDYRAKYYYQNGDVESDVHCITSVLYDSIYYTYKNNKKILEESFSENGLRYSMKFNYKNDTLKEVRKDLPDGSSENILIEHGECY